MLLYTYRPAGAKERYGQEIGENVKPCRVGKIWKSLQGFSALDPPHLSGFLTYRSPM